MTDIIERAESALEEEWNHPQRPWAAQGHSWIAAVWRVVDLVPDLVAELKAARAEKQKVFVDGYNQALKDRSYPA